MDVIVNIFIPIIVVLIIWVILGFLAFLISAKRYKFKEFNKEAKSEFTACIILGLLSFVFMLFCELIDWFNYFMNKLLFKMNTK